MEYTKGEWEVTKWASHSDIHISVNEGSCYRFVANCGNPTEDTLPCNPEAEANAHLIATAVNASIKLNPENPMAVAESISELYEACEIALGLLACYETKATQEVADIIRRVIAKVQRR